MKKEKELIELARKGDLKAFEELVKRNQEEVYFIALKFTNNPIDAEDIASETFLIAYKSIRKFRGECQFSTWLYRICFNLAFYCNKKNKIKVVREITEYDEDGHPRELIDLNSNPYEKVESKQRASVIIKAINKLSKKLREVLLLKEMENLSYDEIAKALHISRGTVMSRLHRAREKLKKILDKEGINLKERE